MNNNKLLADLELLGDILINHSDILVHIKNYVLYDDKLKIEKRVEEWYKIKRELGFNKFN